MGKLGSAGLTSLCALVAFLPVLVIPVLAGGVTGGEVFRRSLVLPNTLFLALAAGMWASVRGTEWLRTVRTALLLLAILLFGPGLVGLLPAQAWGPGAAIGLLSPLGTLFSAGDASYKASPAQYWTSLILVQAAGWALVVSAGFRLRRSWREERGEHPPTGRLRHSLAEPLARPEGQPLPLRGGKKKGEGAAYGSVVDGEATVPTQEPSRVRSPEPAGPWLSCTWTPPVPDSAAAAAPRSSPLGDDANPIAWLLQRQRGTRSLLWAAAVLGLAYHGFLFLGGRFVGPRAFSSTLWPLSLATSALGSALFAWAASRFSVEARRTGELELLLTTPLGAKQIVSTQWQVLKRLLRWPIVVMLAPVFLRAASVIVMWVTGSMRPPYFGLTSALTSVLGCATVLLEVGALCWVGLWFGLRTGGQARAIVWTVTLVKGLPMLFSILFWILVPILFYSLGRRIGQSFWIMSFLPQAVGLLFYLVLIRMARHRLRGELAGAEAVSLGWRQALSSAARSAFAAVRKARHWTPS
jgi:hypothetical protein